MRTAYREAECGRKWRGIGDLGLRIGDWGLGIGDWGLGDSLSRKRWVSVVTRSASPSLRVAANGWGGSLRKRTSFGLAKYAYFSEGDEGDRFCWVSVDRFGAGTGWRAERARSIVDGQWNYRLTGTRFNLAEVVAQIQQDVLAASGGQTLWVDRGIRGLAARQQLKSTGGASGTLRDLFAEVSAG